MIALRPARGHQDVAAGRQGVGDDELELASLVATGREAGAVIPLDPQSAGRERERGAEAIGPLQGCREVGQPQLGHGLTLATGWAGSGRSGSRDRLRNPPRMTIFRGSRA